MEELLPRMLNDILSHEMVQDTQILIRIPRGMSNSLNQCVIGVHKDLHVLCQHVSFVSYSSIFCKVLRNLFVEICAYVLWYLSGFFFKHYVCINHHSIRYFVPKNWKITNCILIFGIWLKQVNRIIFSWNLYT